jgi:hypothetical protein
MSKIARSKIIEITIENLLDLAGGAQLCFWVSVSAAL